VRARQPKRSLQIKLLPQKLLRSLQFSVVDLACAADVRIRNGRATPGALFYLYAKNLQCEKFHIRSHLFAKILAFVAPSAQPDRFPFVLSAAVSGIRVALNPLYGRTRVMTTILPRDEWKGFFERLSRDLAGWLTRVEVTERGTGRHTMSDGLPFAGLAFDARDDHIELSIGISTGNHQTHSIRKPVYVALEGSGLGPKGTLNIEDGSGTKTLIKFIEPSAALLETKSAP
jgi:hypothetical protein